CAEPPAIEGCALEHLASNGDRDHGASMPAGIPEDWNAQPLEGYRILIRTDLDSRPAVVSGPGANLPYACISAMVSCEIWSKVVTAFASASKERWATIRLANWLEIST